MTTRCQGFPCPGLAPLTGAGFNLILNNRLGVNSSGAVRASFQVQSREANTTLLDGNMYVVKLRPYSLSASKSNQ